MDKKSIPQWGISKPNWLEKFFLKTFVKDIVVGEKKYKRNSPTAPEFKVNGEKDLARERERLIQYINQTQEKGASYFEGKDYHSFGVLTSKEWNAMFYKHLDHHLNQFDV